MDLVFQGEVKGDMFYFLLDENLGARRVLLLLQVLDHVGEPHCQAVVAGGGRGGRLGSDKMTDLGRNNDFTEVPVSRVTAADSVSVYVYCMLTPVDSRLLGTR